MLKIKQLKEITILANKFEMVWNKNHNGGSFDFASAKMEIGIKCMKSDPTYTMSIISHEVMEAILSMMGARLDGVRLENNYLFHFDHQTFENAIQLHTELMLKFIQQ